MATVTKKSDEQVGAEEKGRAVSRSRLSENTAATKAPAKTRARKVASAEEAPPKARTRKTATAQEAPAKTRARKVASAEEAPPKARSRRASQGTSSRKKVGTAVEKNTDEVSLPVDSRPGDSPPAARFLPDTSGPLLPEEDLGELPTSYGVDRLWMVPRDPGWMFLHWELSPETAARIAGRRIVLQLRGRQGDGEVTTPPREVGYQGRFYAATMETCEVMQAVLGASTDSGDVEVLLCSDWVPVPPAGPRPGLARFLTIPFDEPLRGGKGLRGQRFVSGEGRMLTEAEYHRLFGRAGPGSRGR